MGGACQERKGMASAKETRRSSSGWKWDSISFSV